MIDFRIKTTFFTTVIAARIVCFRMTLGFCVPISRKQQCLVYVEELVFFLIQLLHSNTWYILYLLPYYVSLSNILVFLKFLYLVLYLYRCVYLYECTHMYAWVLILVYLHRSQKMAWCALYLSPPIPFKTPPFAESSAQVFSAMLKASKASCPPVSPASELGL